MGGDLSALKDPLVPSKEAVARKTQAKNTMRRFAASSMAFPVGLKQVCVEIEARDRHALARDTRTLSGCLGPLIIGQGTTRNRRTIPLSFVARGEPRTSGMAAAATRRSE